jgi:SAM-dependent methyltransferase
VTVLDSDWLRTAAGWDEWDPLLERWLGEATELMLDQAGVAPGSRVLDVAAGAGGQTLAAASRTGSDGLVLGTDIEEELIDRLRLNALLDGARQVYGAVADAAQLDVEPGAFDAAICRLGLMFLPDVHEALRGIRTALRPGGRLSAIVYAEPEHNPFFAIPLNVIRRRAELPMPYPGRPGPFSLARPGVLDAAFGAAGFVDVEVERVDATLRLPSAAECVRFQRESFATLHTMLEDLDRVAQDEAWAEIETELRAFEDADGFSGPCRMLVAGGRRS